MVDLFGIVLIWILAFGGICQSEIVYTMSSDEYKELISTLIF